MGLKQTKKKLSDAKEIVYKEMCDKLEGNCEICPFKTCCIAQQLDDIQIDLERIECKIKEIENE